MTDEPIEVFDADALVAEMRATARPFSLGGRTFKLVPPTAWSDLALDLLTKGEDLNHGDLIVVARELVVGDYTDFVAAGGSAMLVQSLVEKFYGNLGESSASSPSPNRAARRSKRTSSSTTASTSSTSARNGSATAVRKR